MAELGKIRRKKIIFSKFTPSKLITHKFEQNVYLYRLKGWSLPFLKKILDY